MTQTADAQTRDTPTNDPQNGYHYAIIRRAIERIDAAGATPLPLDDLATEMNLSPAHFQRVFSRWAGISPKRYQQFLTLDHARAMLRERRSTLETADTLGLSGGGRLHDLFLRWEAMSPGDYARGGAGLVIRWGWFDTPFGEALVMGTDRGLCGVGFAAETGRDETMQDLRSRWPEASYVLDAPPLTAWVEGAFGQHSSLAPSSEKTPMLLIGGPFQVQVWEALLTIPSGHVTTYSDIAARIGNPKAVRAVGTAVGRNPISWLIPCHRALRKSGGLGGYHWGLPVKRAMLAYETAQLEEERIRSALAGRPTPT